MKPHFLLSFISKPSSFHGYPITTNNQSTSPAPTIHYRKQRNSSTPRLTSTMTRISAQSFSILLGLFSLVLRIFPVQSRIRSKPDEDQQGLAIKRYPKKSTVSFIDAREACKRASSPQKRNLCIHDVMSFGDVGQAEDSFYE